MAQVVERRLPAIYDALDSRNNKVYCITSFETVPLSTQSQEISINNLCMRAASAKADKQRAAEAVQKPDAACVESYSFTANWQG